MNPACIFRDGMEPWKILERFPLIKMNFKGKNKWQLSHMKKAKCSWKQYVFCCGMNDSWKPWSFNQTLAKLHWITTSENQSLLKLLQLILPPHPHSPPYPHPPTPHLRTSLYEKSKYGERGKSKCRHCHIRSRVFGVGGGGGVGSKFNGICLVFESYPEKPDINHSIFLPPPAMSDYVLCKGSDYFGTSYTVPKKLGFSRFRWLQLQLKYLGIVRDSPTAAPIPPSFRTQTIYLGHFRDSHA